MFSYSTKYLSLLKKTPNYNISDHPKKKVHPEYGVIGYLNEH